MEEEGMAAASISPGFVLSRSIIRQGSVTGIRFIPEFSFHLFEGRHRRFLVFFLVLTMDERPSSWQRLANFIDI